MSKFKLKPEHREYIEKRVTEVLAHASAEKLVEKYERGEFPKSEKVNDLQMRFCFDIFYVCGLERYISEHVYSYANDTHLYNFLKSICPKVVRRY